MVRRTLLWLAAALTACSSAGPCGYSRTYDAGDAEDDAVESATEYDPVMVQRRRHEWRNKDVMLFGIVTDLRDSDDGKAILALSMRTLAERNLCEEAEEETCRVTVSEHEHATVHAVVQLSASDARGKRPVATGSLVRIVGRVADDPAADGVPTIRARYYRHWPHREYVTTAARSYMLR
jgi:hypothetical protein